MNLTQRQIEIIEQIENIDYVKTNYKIVDVIVKNLGYIILENDLYYIRTYHYLVKCNRNIITEDNPFRKEVYMVNSNLIKI